MNAPRERLPLWLPVLALLLSALVVTSWNDARTERAASAQQAATDCPAPRDGEVVLIMVRVEAGQLVSRCTLGKGRT